MDKNYLDSLKSLAGNRSTKIKIKSRSETILNEQENKMDDIHNKIIKWFMENPYPDDNKVHEFAKSNNIEPDKLEGHIYMILSSILNEGKSKNFKGSYDPEEVKNGIEVELEHTPNRLIAEKISKDHLSEISDYYTRLSKMEKAAGINEIFIQSSEIEAMSSGKERDRQILRLGIIAELDASNLYEKLAGLASDKRVKTLMLDISREEKTHSGEFQFLLKQIDPEFDEELTKGEDEAEELI